MKNLIAPIILLCLTMVCTMNAQPYKTFKPDNIVAEPALHPSDVNHLFDGSINTYWNSNRAVNPNINNPEIIEMQYSNPTAIDSLFLRSLNLDERRKDPFNFKIEAKGNGATDTWTLLLERSESIPLFVQKGELLKFKLNNTKAYPKYRIVIYKARTTYLKNVALAELEMRGPEVEPDLHLEIFQIKVSIGSSTLAVVKDYNVSPAKVVSSTLIDAGDNSEDGVLIAKVIKNKASSKLDRILITHDDKDHIGGLVSLLPLRCSDKVINGINIQPENPVSNKLDLYLVEATKKIHVEPKITQFVSANTLQKFVWQNNLDLELSPSSTTGNKPIKFITLAANGVLRDLGTTIDKLNANNRSGVALIVWDDFSFLIQGDMQAAGKGQSIGRTNDDYISPSTRIPENWNSSITSVQSAKSIKVTKDNLTGRTTDGIKRIGLGELDKPTAPKPELISLVTPSNPLKPTRKERKQLKMFYFQKYIAYPNEWLFDLGINIKDYNGSDKYGHACVSLVPHHGGMTSNLWFDSDHGIVSCNRKGDYGHPVPQAMEAAYYTSGIKNFYFTYLEDGWENNHVIINRKSELNSWKSSISDPSLNFEVLSSSEDFFKVEVKIVDDVKKFKISNGDGSGGVFKKCQH